MGAMTRIGFISDIHADVNAGAFGDGGLGAALAQVARKRALDVLVIAGDVAGDYRVTLDIIRRLRDDSGARVLFVPGNHDLWNRRHPGMDAQDIYEALLQDEGNLARGPRAIAPGWVISGDTGWYDYAFGDPAFSSADFDAMRLDRRTWQDRAWAKWDLPAPDVHRRFMARMEGALDAAAAIDAGTPLVARRIARGIDLGPAGPAERAPPHLILVTHVVQRREFIVPAHWKSWHYFNAFLGSPEYGELALRRQAAISVFGHVHFRKRLLDGLTEFICPCLGYERQWWVAAGDPVAELEAALVVRELG